MRSRLSFVLFAMTWISGRAVADETAVFVVPTDGGPATRYNVVAEMTRDVGGVERSRGVARTPAGSVISIVNTQYSTRDARRFVYDVRVDSVGVGDGAFATGYEADTAVGALAEADVFVPGVWYGTSANTPPSGLTHDVGQADFLIREDRMALPLVSVRDRKTGRTITLTHDDPDGATILADAKPDRLIDARLRFGSIGLRREQGKPLKLAFRFPGTEAEQTAIGGFKPARRAAERYHPLVVGATQHYELTVRTTTADDLAGQIRDAWRDAFERTKPAAVPLDSAAVYDASVGVLAHYAFDRDHVSGIPFAVKLPGGEVRDRSLQMGFVGQQLPCASYLIDDGLRTHRPDRVEQGERIIDFWTRESVSPAGVPRTWFDVDPRPKWRNYPTFLRVVTDGTSGALRAWQIERAAGRDRRVWLSFCRRVGDWLLNVQNPDGSFFRAWNFEDGSPHSRSLTNTLHPVRLLVDLACATGDTKYRVAALRAAEWSLAHDAPGRYVGGTPDNPDVIDKEAGWIAFDSYLALFDVTGEKRWLDAAAAAATFTETWIYGWNVRLPIDIENPQIPRLKTTAGAASLIATGHSGADLFLAFASLSYARLSVYTGDTHFADVARLLQANTAQLVDVNGSLGYATPGLCVEAFSLVGGRRGSSVGVWLPWGTSAVLEPMARCREMFGTTDVAAALQLKPADLRHRHEAWARIRGYPQ